MSQVLVEIPKLYNKFYLVRFRLLQTWNIILGFSELPINADVWS